MTPSFGFALALAACEAPEALVRLDHAIVKPLPGTMGADPPEEVL